ncbi:hypothetical protein D3C71_2167610 [compost metagenome]
MRLHVVHAARDVFLLAFDDGAHVGHEGADVHLAVVDRQEVQLLVVKDAGQ